MNKGGLSYRMNYYGVLKRKEFVGYDTDNFIVK